MKGSITTPDSVDPYAALENILKTIGRFWLSEEWRLEDIRLLAQEAIEKRGRTPQRASRSGVRSPRSQKRHTG